MRALDPSRDPSAVYHFQKTLNVACFFSGKVDDITDNRVNGCSDKEALDLRLWT